MANKIKKFLKPDKKPLLYSGDPEVEMEGPVSTLFQKVAEYMAEDGGETTEKDSSKNSDKDDEKIAPEVKKGRKMVEFEKAHDGKPKKKSDEDSAKDAEKWHNEG